jgi:hypothetical protein
MHWFALALCWHTLVQAAADARTIHAPASAVLIG